MENGPLVDLHIKQGDFAIAMLAYWRVAVLVKQIPIAMRIQWETEPGALPSTDLLLRPWPMAEAMCLGANAGECPGVPMVQQQKGCSVLNPSIFRDHFAMGMLTKTWISSMNEGHIWDST